MTDSNIQPRGTTAHTPDLNWSQIRETVLMLELAAVQIETAMKDSDASVAALTDSFTSMAGYIRTISDTVEALPETEEMAGVKQSLIGTSGQVSGLVHQAIVAFQFYDKLVQRLSHVGHSLGALSDLVADQRRLYNPHEWVGLQEKIRSQYSTREEIAMFEAVMQGISIHEAVERCMAEMSQKSDDIEFF